MKRLLSLLCVATLALSASAQTLGECQALGPVPPIGGTPDCEGLTGNLAEITSTAGCTPGMPTEGTRFARITAGATAPLLSQNAPVGSQITRPIPAGSAELQIPLTSGSYAISLDYSWFNSEGGSAQWTDGFDISVCDSAGNLVAIIASGFGASNTSCSGVTSVSTGILTIPGGAYISCVAFNGGDTCCAPGTVLEIDNVAAPAVPPFVLTVTSPGGVGTLQTNLTNGAPFGLFFMGVALSPGAFPNGVFYGIDLSLFDVLQQASLGVPFLGGLDGGGGYQFGPIGGVPSGLTFYAVALDNILSLTPAVSAPVSHTVP